MKLAILLIISLLTFLIAVYLSGAPENDKICDDQGDRALKL